MMNPLPRSLGGTIYLPKQAPRPYSAYMGPRLEWCFEDVQDDLLRILRYYYDPL